MIHYQEVVTRGLTALLAGTIFLVLLFYLPAQYFSYALFTLMTFILYAEWEPLARSSRTMLLLTPLYPVLPFIMLIILNHNQACHYLLYYLFLMVFSHDTGSYLAGITFGKTLLLPSISPKKTWEGFFGGYCLTLAVLWGLCWWRQATIPLFFALIFTFCVCIIATAGDLFESWLKRKAGVKDSGTILPGHGGLLDRLDGVLFAVVIFYSLRNYLITVLG